MIVFKNKRSNDNGGEYTKSINTNFNYLVTLENIDSISKVKKNDFKKTQNRIR